MFKVGEEGAWVWRLVRMKYYSKKRFDIPFPRKEKDVNTEVEKKRHPFCLRRSPQSLMVVEMKVIELLSMSRLKGFEILASQDKIFPHLES